MATGTRYAGAAPAAVGHRRGKPCYLSTDGRGYLATLADNMESVQLGMGKELLEYARDTKAPGAKILTATEYRWLASRLTEALSDALRVADSRGQRLPGPQEEKEADNDV